ncbi:MAG: ROK family protein [Oleibacter sp.]|nr:ROK family protein [Thalassolituus sp.]
MLQLGIDLGGTKIEIVALDEHGHELLRRRIPTPSHSYDAILATLIQLINDASAQYQGPATIGLGIPGALSFQTGLVKNANTQCLIGKDLKGDLERALQQPVAIANDADCLALSEATDGAGAGYQSVFAVILGTGCGGGWVINGHLVGGPNAISGEWGHNPLTWRNDSDDQVLCYCGQIGCLESLISGTGLRRQALSETGINQTAQLWIESARAGDHIASEVMEKYYVRVAKALASIINIMDPHAIVVGGGVSNIPELYQRVPQLWQKWVFSDTVVTPLLHSKYGDSSGVRGAAWLGASAGKNS